MKRTLLTGTALATAAMLAASPASAEIKVSAYMDWGIGAGDTDIVVGGPRNGYATATNSEVHFKGSGKTDAGLEYGFTIEVEGDGAGIDERSMFLSGAFGKVTLGANDAAMDPEIDGSVYGVPGGIGDEDVGLAGALRTGEAKSENDLTDGGDNLMMMYESPRVGGIQAKISLTPAGGRSADGAGTYQNMWGANINTSHKFEGVGIKLNASGVHSGISGAGAASVSTPGDEPELNGYTIGAALDWEGVKFEIGYMRQHDSDSVSGGDDDTAFVVGLGYGQGPWSVAVEYTATDEDVSKDELQGYSVEAAYNIAKGLTVTGAFVAAEVTDASVGEAYDYQTVTAAIQMSF